MRNAGERAGGPGSYWLLQLGGWGLYALVSLALRGARDGRSVVSVLLLVALGLLLTHATRALARRRRWAERSLAGLVARLVPTGLALGTLCSLAVCTLNVYALGLYRPEDLRPGLYVFAALTFSVVFYLWLALYFGLQFARRSRDAELAGLRLERAAQAAELRALEAQLNPHFLFNCLNGLRGLIGEDPARAQAMVGELANVLRYTLGTRNAATVPLEDELGAVESYLALEAIRFEERLRFRLAVEPEARRASVPAMLVQTLVENAIKHGIALRPDGGELAIAARVRDGALELSVTNPAAPAETSARRGPPGGGVGLANTAERLRLLYGERASVALERGEAAHTTARVRLPVAP